MLQAQLKDPRMASRSDAPGTHRSRISRRIGNGKRQSGDWRLGFTGEGAPQQLALPAFALVCAAAALVSGHLWFEYKAANGAFVTQAERTAPPGKQARTTTD